MSGEEGAYRVVPKLGEDALHGLLVLFALILRSAACTYATLLRLAKQLEQLGVFDVHIVAVCVDRLEQVLHAASETIVVVRR